MLKIQQLRVSYGGIQALRGIDLEVPDGKIVTLIGANGAGKSTTLRTISGLVKAESGSIQWNGEELLGKPIDKIISAGIAMSPEGRRVFADLTVLENLKLGAYLRKDKAEIEKDLKWVYELFPRLEERNWQSAGTLSGGEQQMLAVGRALMSRPKLMMLDEPSLGLAPLVVQDIFSIIREINRQGVTVLLIEQNANMALKIADLAYVLETGNITMSGTGAELLANEKIKEAYASLLFLRFHCRCRGTPEAAGRRRGPKEGRAAFAENMWGERTIRPFFFCADFSERRMKCQNPETLNQSDFPVPFR